jgi:formylglycine-generating enzyme required for sulfatase activity/dienelactone hydrolase/predicted Ser/Thr protein kinase
MIGTSISHYEVLEELGRGGMGILYRARDTRLDRLVAIKVLHAEAVSSADRRQRFIREAKAASALNHPHIVTVYEVDRWSSNGVEHDFIVMEHIDGTSLDKRLAGGTLEMAEAIEYATQVADALSAAHEAGIIHRDVKPANIMVTPRGQVKLVDFGLAKLTEPLSFDSDAPSRSANPLTERGAILGTAAYMSPEQAEGRPVDRRTDIFSFGVVLYEMLTGRRAFQEDTAVATRVAILSRTPPTVRSIRPEVTAALERIVSRCLQKDRDARYASAVELAEDLRRLRANAMHQLPSWMRPRVLIPAAVALGIVAAVGGWQWLRNSRVRWAREVALPEIARLADSQDTVAAYDLAQQARRYLPHDRQLERLLNTITLTGSLRSDPPGADVSWKPYAQPDAPWRALGRTPLEDFPFPAGYFRWRFEKPGYDPVERAAPITRKQDVILHPSGSSPPNMVWVPAGPGVIRIAGVTNRRGGSAPLQLGGFWIDTFEVTNRQFKAFVDAGGYRKAEFWKHLFIREGRELVRDQAMRELVDKTGQPGPAGWELGTYPPDEGDYPVRGVSWFEAAAYAEFAGKSLPTVHHWLAATDRASPAEVGEFSNFDGRGPDRVGARKGLGPFGNHDMAGNVKEWCFNSDGGSRRYTLGGAWNEPTYMYRSAHAQPPFERLETDGFRCAKYAEPPAAPLTAAIERTWRDYSREKPVDDATFRLYASLYQYDRTPLEPTVETLESGSPYWSEEKVTFNAAYGGERVIGYLFLPLNAKPPFQTVVFFPGSGAETRPSHEGLEQQYVDFVIRSGRALLLPIYKGTYERRLRERPPEESRALRDLQIQCYQDLGRSVDYLMTRGDVDAGKLAYYGFSLGASLGVMYTAVDKRFKASILFAGGFDSDTPLPEVDQINFATRVTTPTLMLNGRDDFRFPLEESQKPLFRLLGTPPEHKRHLLIRGGHVPPRLEIIKGVLDWLDLYLGPVETKG